MCVALLLLLLLAAASAQQFDEGLSSPQSRRNETQVVEFHPAQLLKVVEGTHHLVTWTTDLQGVARVDARVDDEMVSSVEQVGEILREVNGTYRGSLNVSALFIGYSDVHITLYDEAGEVLGRQTLAMSVLLSYQHINDIFVLVIGVLVAVLYVNMGATMDLQVVKGITKKPVGPLLGMFCQYVLMPLIAFGLGKLAFPDNVLAQLGMFLTGCSPGGGQSNMWTLIIGGSLDLSIMMTFFSTVFAFGTLPLWVFLLGPVIMGDTDFVIPYKDIAQLVLSLAIPCCIGLLIQRYLPRVAKILEKLLTPLAVFNIIFIFTFGVYANLYIFTFFTLKTMLIGLALPVCGYLSGFILAKLARLPLADVIAISIETGIQNASVAMFILKFTLDKPAGDLTVVFPAASTIMTPLPLLVAVVAKFIHQRLVASSSLDIKVHPDKNSKIDPEKEGGKKEETKSGGDKNEGGLKLEGGVDNPAVEMDEAV